jgi:putative oxidoreductase
MKRIVFIETICYAFFFLFIYTAISKLLIYNTFLSDLHRSPLIGSLAGFVSIFIPLLELAAAGMVLFIQTRKWGLYLSLILMALFTGYVGYVLGMTHDRPCNCGGIIRNLSWKNHMILNTSLMVLSVIGIWLNQHTDKDDNSRLDYTTHRIA